jgi:acetolactate synthase-1/2/3 large subunit
MVDERSATDAEADTTVATETGPDATPDEQPATEPATEPEVAPAPEEAATDDGVVVEVGATDGVDAAENLEPGPESAEAVETADAPQSEIRSADGGDATEAGLTLDAAADASEAETAPEDDGDEPAADEPSEPSAEGVEAVASDEPRTAGRFIADALRAAGVRYAFTVPGESFLGLLEGLRDAGIRVIATRHEGGAAFMAEAHGQLTGRPAVALGTRAVGASNLAIGIHTARQDSTPMFVLVGQVERPFRGREAFQEIDQAATIGGLAASAAELSDLETLPGLVAAAVRTVTTGRPGPAFLAVPEDLIDETLPAGTTLDASRPAPVRPEPDAIRRAIQFLATAQRPVILAGGGVLRARTSTELVRFAELLRVPVIAGWRRADVVPNDHPLYLGMAGYGSPAAVRERLEAADALLVLGCRLSEITSFGYRIPADGQAWLHVDVEPLGDRDGLPAPVETIASDARVFLRTAAGRLQQGVLDAASADARQARNEEDRATWEAATSVDEEAWTGAGVHPAHAVATARRVLPDDAIVTTDAGNFGLWIARHFRFRRPGTFLGPTSGAMGYALPAAIAAALVHRDRTVVAFAGDGGFAMTMAELETAVREKAKVIAVVFDNERYGTIRMHQDRRDASDAGIATDLGPVDFAGIARAVGARGIRVETEAAFEQALRQAMANDRPTVVQVALDRGWVHPDQPFAGPPA